MRIGIPHGNLLSSTSNTVGGKREVERNCVFQMLLIELSAWAFFKISLTDKEGETKGDYNIQQIINGNHYVEDRTLILPFITRLQHCEGDVTDTHTHTHTHTHRHTQRVDE
jgi:hypothetical protein